MTWIERIVLRVALELPHQVKGRASPHQRWPLGPQCCEKACFVVYSSPGCAMSQIDVKLFFLASFSVCKTFFHVKNIAVNCEILSLDFTLKPITFSRPMDSPSTAETIVRDIAL